MPGGTVANRYLAGLLRMMGADTAGNQPDVGELVVPTYQLANAQFGLASRATLQAAFTSIPSTGVANFSAVEFVTPFGVWIRRMLNGGGSAAFFNASLQGTGLVVVDGSLPTVQVFPPEVTFSSTQGGQFPFPTDCRAPAQFLVGNTGVGNKPSPELFVSLQQGQRSALPSVNGIFVAGASEGVRDVWVQPGVMVVIACNVANTALSVHLELEFPSVYFE